VDLLSIIRHLSTQPHHVRAEFLNFELANLPPRGNIHINWSPGATSDEWSLIWFVAAYQSVGADFSSLFKAVEMYKPMETVLWATKRLKSRVEYDSQKSDMDTSVPLTLAVTFKLDLIDQALLFQKTPRAFQDSDMIQALEARNDAELTLKVWNLAPQAMPKVIVPYFPQLKDSALWENFIISPDAVVAFFNIAGGAVYKKMARADIVRNRSLFRSFVTSIAENHPGLVALIPFVKTLSDLPSLAPR
jgi:hypothetical protein